MDDLESLDNLIQGLTKQWVKQVPSATVKLVVLSHASRSDL
jgi:hypothetical protein